MDTPPQAAAHPLHLVYATDVNFLLPVGASLCSARLLASRPEDLFIHILDCDIPDDKWDAWVTSLRKAIPNLSLIRHRMDMEHFKSFRAWHGSFAAYARLDLPQLLPDVDWCLYVDGDTLFYDDPFILQPYCDNTIPILGHYDRPFSLHPWYEQWKREGLEFTYFCSGFILMNLAWFRANNGTQRCLDFLREHPETRAPDQDALNELSKGQSKMLPEAWGVFPREAFFADWPGCVHYAAALPTKTAFNRTYGFPDITAAWFVFAKTVLGVSVQEACGVPRWKWALGRLYNHLLRFYVAVCSHLPLFKNLPSVQRLEPYFPNKTQRRILSPKLWQEALCRTRNLSQPLP